MSGGVICWLHSGYCNVVCHIILFENNKNNADIYIYIHISICIYVDVYVYALYRLIYLRILRLSVEAAVEDMVGQLQLATCIFKPEDR